MNKRLFLLPAILVLGLCSAANANLILFDTYKNTPENTLHIVSVAAADFGVPNLQNLLRLDDLAFPGAGSPFSISYTQINTGKGGNANNGANISWNLTGTGFNLLGVYVFGGSNGANLYKVGDLTQMLVGSATIHTPLTGASGKYATISHLLFLGTTGNAVPESGSTLVLFAITLVVLFGVRAIHIRRA